MKKGLMIGGILVVVLLGAGGYYLYSNSSSLIKTAVETFGSEITQADVTLDGVDLSPSDGAGALRGLTDSDQFELTGVVRLDVFVAWRSCNSGNAGLCEGFIADHRHAERRENCQTEEKMRSR